MKEDLEESERNFHTFNPNKHKYPFEEVINIMWEEIENFSEENTDTYEQLYMQKKILLSLVTRYLKSIKKYKNLDISKEDFTELDW